MKVSVDKIGDMPSPFQSISLRSCKCFGKDIILSMNASAYPDMIITISISKDDIKEIKTLLKT